MKILNLLAVLFISSSLFAGGPWGQEKGKAYLQFGGGFIPSTNQLFFKANETLNLNRRVSDANVGLYAEYGLLKNFTVIAELPINFVATSSEIEPNATSSLLPSGSLAGFGNTRLTAQYLFYEGTIKLAGGIKFSLPTAITEAETGLRTGYQSFDVMPRLSAGYSKGKFYSYSEIGYNFRTKLANDIHISAEAGYKVYKEIYVALNFGALLSSLDRNELILNDEQTGLYANGQEFAALTLKLSFPIKNNIGFNLSSTASNFHGNLVQKSPAFGASLYWKI
ncbi:MAG: hypothetical protein ABF242_02635 [Flavobacteriales bacterium]